MKARGWADARSIGSWIANREWKETPEGRGRRRVRD